MYGDHAYGSRTYGGGTLGVTGAAAPPAQTIHVGTVASAAVVNGPNIFEPRTIAVGPVHSAPVVYGPRFTFPGAPEPAERIVVRLFDPSNLAAELAVLENSWGRRWLDQLNDAGSGSVNLQNDDADLASVDYHRVVRFDLDGEARFAMVVEGQRRISVAQDEEVGEYVTLSGRGLLALWEDGLTYPENGPGQEPFGETRFFNFTARAFDDAGWGQAVATLPADDNFGAPEGWPDPSAQWIWDRNAGGGFGTPPTFVPGTVPVGDVYFRFTFTVAADTTAQLWAAADDDYELYLDGVLLLRDGPLYLGQSRNETLDVSAGTHLLAVRATNRIWKGGVRATLMALNNDGSLGAVLANTRGTLDFPVEATNAAALWTAAADEHAEAEALWTAAAAAANAAGKPAAANAATDAATAANTAEASCDAAAAAWTTASTALTSGSVTAAEAAQLQAATDSDSAWSAAEATTTVDFGAAVTEQNLALQASAEARDKADEAERAGDVALLAWDDPGSLGWKVLGYPNPVPGFTPGRIIRVLLEEAQARGGLTGWALDFTDHVDSAGNAWPVTTDVAVEMGQDLFAVLRQLAETYIDLAVAPAQLRLSAWNIGERGRVSATVLARTVNLTELVHEGHG